MPEITISVNGHAVSADVEPRELLSGFLREVAGQTGTHIGCDTSQCGACAVHVDGKLVKSCAMLAVEADGASVRTVEGMSNADGSLSTLQAAFVEHHGLQCGFCTPGMIMSAAALLNDNPKPTESEIREHLEGNMCRCTGYHNIVRAILSASGQDVAPITAQ